MIKFPEHIDGWLTSHEGMALAVYAHGKTVLEIGAFKGRSTVCLAQTALKVVCVDPFDGRATPKLGPTLKEFQANVKDYGNVSWHVGTMDDVGWEMVPEFDLVFIDGDHTYGAVHNDIEWALTLLRPGGHIVFHDYRFGTNGQGFDPGVEQAVNEFLSHGARMVARHGSLAVVAPPVELQNTGAPRVVMGMPFCKGIRCTRSEVAFRDKATSRPLWIDRVMSDSSVLELSFNRFWDKALNDKEEHGATHAVMLHDDVCPEDGWLDTLLDEMERTGADVISCVVPIKSPEGLTSTAIGWGTGNPFRPLRRLTMHEVMTLPETFGREDVTLEGPPDLMVNTGCWIADLRQPWVESNVFRNVSRRVKSGGKWKTECLSEDWAFSCDLVRWGAKVLATRKVKLYHDNRAFNNHTAWGLWDTDHEYGKRLEAADHGGIRRRLAAIADRLRQRQDQEPAICGGPAGNGPAVV